MTDINYNWLETTLVNGLKNKQDIEWIKAFTIYNESMGKRLSMGCLPCYYKVYRYLIENKELTNGAS